MNYLQEKKKQNKIFDAATKGHTFWNQRLCIDRLQNFSKGWISNWPSSWRTKNSPKLTRLSMKFFPSEETGVKTFQLKPIYPSPSVSNSMQKICWKCIWALRFDKCTHVNREKNHRKTVNCNLDSFIQLVLKRAFRKTIFVFQLNFPQIVFESTQQN